jgi:alkylated DNA repair dioxygenase AlkB
MSIIDLLTFKPNFFDVFTFEEVDAAHSWVNRDGAPRDECFMSKTGAPYTYGSGRGERTYEPIPFSPLVDKLREHVSREVGADYELCFSNRYSDKGKHLGWHADDGKTIDHRVGIAIVSFGATREIWFRPNPLLNLSAGQKWDVGNAMTQSLLVQGAMPAIGQTARPADGPPESPEKLLLPHGSLCIMPPGFQQTHQHRIPKADRDVGVRISLTFRKAL